MKTYIGKKIIKAKPMTKKEYNDYRGWIIPPGEDPEEEVYLVEYPVDSQSPPNHILHKGYISMSPKHVFDKAYHLLEEGVSFGDALIALQEGKRVQRRGWNGAGLFAFKQVHADIPMIVIPGMQSLPQAVKDEFIRRSVENEDKISSEGGEKPELKTIRYRNQMCIVYPDNTVYAWAPSVNDTCNHDWVILD
jgi:hypothetical protein